MMKLVIHTPTLYCDVSPLSPSLFLSIGMAPEVWLPPICRPQNVSAAFCSSHAVRYRCHAAPLRPQCHRDSGRHHYRVSHTLIKESFKDATKWEVGVVCFIHDVFLLYKNLNRREVMASCTSSLF